MRFQQPVYKVDLFDGKVTVIVFGASRNWNYAGSSKEEMEAKNPGITDAIMAAMQEYGIERAFVPKPAFNAQVATEKDLKIELIPNFFRGADADGVIMTKPGDAYFLASADCLTTALFDGRTGAVAALHCGRDALIDRKWINEDKGELKREFSSVVDAGVRLLDHHFQYTHLSSPDMYRNNEMGWLRGGDEENLFKLTDHAQMAAYLAAGIRPDTFTHPPVGKYMIPNGLMIDHLLNFETKTNSAWKRKPFCDDLVPRHRHPPVVTDPKEGKIDLFALVRRQLDEHNVERVEEDEFDTATSKGPDNEFLFHSNRRDPTLRNLVIVKLN